MLKIFPHVHDVCINYNTKLGELASRPFPHWTTKFRVGEKVSLAHSWKKHLKFHKIVKFDSFARYYKK